MNTNQMRYNIQGINIKYRFFKVNWIVFLIFICGISVFACEASKNSRSDFSDAQISSQINQVERLVKKLIVSDHPDPVAFLNSPEHLSENPELLDLFRKYVGTAYYFYEFRKDNDSALIYADSTMQLFEKEFNDRVYKTFHLYAILLKGDILRKQNLYGTSIQYLLQGWQMINPEQMPCMAAEFLNRMASVSYQQENYPGAIDFYTRSWQISANCSGQSDFNRFKITFQYYQNLASSYEQLQVPDSALHYNNRSLNILANESENFINEPDYRQFIETARGVALGNKGTVCWKLDRTDEAESLWKESIRINLQPGFANEHAQLTRLRLAEYYIDTDRMDEAKEELTLVRDWLDRFQSETGERRWRKANWRWLDRMGNTEKAYTAYKEYVELQEAAVDHRMELGAIDLAAQIQLTEQQNEIAQLQTVGEVRNMYLVSATIISLMVIAILFLIWRSWRDSKKNVLQLVNLNKTISTQNLQLEKNNQILSKIMNVVAHDLRSPLVGVTEISALMLEDEKLTGKQRKWLEVMHDTISRSMKLAKEVLNLNFFKRDSSTIQKRPVDMHEFLQQCSDIKQLQAKEKNQSVEIEMKIDEKIIVPMDDDEMFRVINNVVDNAIKFSPEGSTIFLRLERNDGSVRLSVTDEGIGIPDKLKERVFDMFTEARRAGTNDEQSFGLGLSISKQIVDAHGGMIWFESNDGAGTTFYIELPVEENQLTEAV